MFAKKVPHLFWDIWDTSYFTSGPLYASIRFVRATRRPASLPEVAHTRMLYMNGEGWDADGSLRWRSWCFSFSMCHYCKIMWELGRVCVRGGSLQWLAQSGVTQRGPGAPEMSFLLQGPWWSVALHAVILSPWCAEVRMPTEEDAAAPCVLRRIIWQQTRQRGGPKKKRISPGFQKSNDLPRLTAD